MLRRLCKAGAALIFCSSATLATRQYFIRTKEVSWTDAKTNCVNEGKQLASFGSSSDMDQMSCNPSYEKDTKYWLGLNDRDKEGQFVYSDGTSLGCEFSSPRKLFSRLP